MNNTRLLIEPIWVESTDPANMPAPMEIDLSIFLPLTDEQFYLFCQRNKDLRIERTANGEIEIMMPVGGESGGRNADVTAQLVVWAKRDKTGIAFDSSTGFKLPNGANRSPDSAWVKRERLATLSAQEKTEFLPLCPDFVIELRSKSDSLSKLQTKMQEWIENGAQLGWLIDPITRSVYIYRPDLPVEHLQHIYSVSAEPLLPGFVLDLADVWHVGF